MIKGRLEGQCLPLLKSIENLFDGRQSSQIRMEIEKEDHGFFQNDDEMIRFFPPASKLSVTALRKTREESIETTTTHGTHSCCTRAGADIRSESDSHNCFIMLEAIVYKKESLLVLDQLQLPQKTHYDDVKNIKEGWEVIKSMKVRGAPAISIVAALSLSVELSQKNFNSKDELHDFIVHSVDYLCTSRPTAVNLMNVGDILRKLSKQYSQDRSLSVDGMKERLIEKMERLLKGDIQINKNIGCFGGKHMLENCGGKPMISVLTHCNTGSLATAGYGTALGVIRWLHENKHLHQAYCTETRPYNQGARLTAFELVHDKIPATLICDSMVASLMRSGKVSAVVVGADRVVLNGDTANKIGTYQLAVCAKYHNIPFYVACPRSTFDFNLATGDLIPIEERPHHEMLTINSVRIAAEGINCWNPAFDVTPASLITGGIITEVGVYPPHELKNNIELLSSADLFN